MLQATHSRSPHVTGAAIEVRQLEERSLIVKANACCAELFVLHARGLCRRLLRVRVVQLPSAGDQACFSARLRSAARQKLQSCGDRSECALGTHDASPLLGGEVVNIFDRHPCRQALGMGLQPKGEDLEHALPCPPSSGQKIDRARPQKQKDSISLSRKATGTTGRKACSAAAGSAEGCAMGSRACWRCVRWAS